MSSRNFSVNKFVLLKIGEEWFEGKITEVIQNKLCDNTEQFYKVYLFRLYSEISNPVKENLLFNSTLENFKKFRVSSLRKMTKKIHLPENLKEIMDAEKHNIEHGIFTRIPSKQPVSKILNDFKKYIQINKPNILEEELEEVVLGFFHIFELVFHKVLLYENEKSYINKSLSDLKEQRSSDIFGAEYLLRSLYLIQSNLIDQIRCEDTKNMVFDFSVYLLDFLGVHVAKYFGVNK